MILWRVLMVIGLLFVFSINETQAQTDTAFINKLLKRIDQQQTKKDIFFIEGIFPSYIDQAYKGYSTRHKDNNIFFTSLILYSLENIKDRLDKSSQIIIDTITAHSKKTFEKFQNKKGRGTYNFWRTDSSFQFPYNSLVKYFTHSWQLPDDMDCTVMSLMAMHANDSVAEKIHLLMQQFSGYPVRKIRSVPSNYKMIPAYSTWFGKDFPVFYDVCVASNVLTFVQTYQLPWTKADSATLQMLVTSIVSKDYLNKYKSISPYYVQPSVILYHYARLMQVSEIPELEKYKTQLIKDAVQLFSKTDNLLEKMILCNAIQKWGYYSPALQLPDSQELLEQVEKNDFPFFVEDMTSYYTEPYKTLLSISLKKILLYNHYCPAYNDVLLLEYLALNK